MSISFSIKILSQTASNCRVFGFSHNEGILAEMQLGNSSAYRSIISDINGNRYCGTAIASAKKAIEWLEGLDYRHGLARLAKELIELHTENVTISDKDKSGEFYIENICVEIAWG